MAITITNLLYYLYCLYRPYYPTLGNWSYIFINLLLYFYIFILYRMILIYHLFKLFPYYHKVYKRILMLWPSGRTDRCCCYLLIANNWPSFIIMYYNVGCLCYLEDMCLSYEGPLPKPKSTRTGHLISMLYSFRAEVGSFVHCVLHIKHRWWPLQTDGQGRSPFICGCLTISVEHISIANDGIILVGTPYKTAKLMI